MNDSSSRVWDRTAIAKSRSIRINNSRHIESLIVRAKRSASEMTERTGDDSNVHPLPRRWILEQTQLLRNSIRDHHANSQGDQPHAMSFRDEHLITAISLVVIAVGRTLGISLFDVQLHAGIVVSLGAVAEMQTGEGKTLAGVLPAFLHSLNGRGVHVATPNSHLAARDYKQLSPVFEMLGVSTGLIQDDCDDDEARAAYRADVTYGASHTFGFDYLRDQVLKQKSLDVPLGHRTLTRLKGLNPTPVRQRGLVTAIVDEADDVLLDDAMSPMILSSEASGEAPDATIHRAAHSVAMRLQSGTHFAQLTRETVALTHAGLDTIYSDGFLSVGHRFQRPWHEYVQSALRATHCFQRDVHYIVRDDRVRIIDNSTGRVFADRTWSGGLHQAVEASEELMIRPESIALARITKQRFYRSYGFLGGMTGTVDGCEPEFASVYGMPVGVVPPRLRSRRQWLPTKILMTQSEKWNAVVGEAIQVSSAGRPVLIGTLNIADSLEIADQLRTHDCEFQLLNGVQDAEEASVIARAGQTAMITVATNLAGRGTDIKVTDDGIRRGGLHVIVTQTHRYQRVDRQLVGRGARCGDPGSTRTFMATDDPLIAQDAPWIGRGMQRALRRATRATTMNEIDPSGPPLTMVTTRQFDRPVHSLQRRHQRTAMSNRLRLLRADLEEQEFFEFDAKPTARCWAM